MFKVSEFVFWNFSNFFTTKFGQPGSGESTWIDLQLAVIIFLKWRKSNMAESKTPDLQISSKHTGWMISWRWSFYIYVFNCSRVWGLKVPCVLRMGVYLSCGFVISGWFFGHSGLSTRMFPFHPPTHEGCKLTFISFTLYITQFVMLLLSLSSPATSRTSRQTWPKWTRNGACGKGAIMHE